MITIKFSYQYTKMPPDTKNTVLVDVELINLEDLSKDFLEKDTEIVGGGHYSLPPRGKFMILWLDTNGHMWQTIRRWTPAKERYYRKHVMENVNIEVEGTP